jgi:hypothetical protein
MFDRKPGAMANKVELILSLAKLDGPIAEFGVNNGGNIWRLAESGREIWAFDTFEGLPAEDYLEEDKQNPPGCFHSVPGTVEFLESIPNVVVRKGRFVNTLPTIPAGLKFSVISLDCDYYLSYKQVLEYLESHGHIGPGTVIVMDDYDHLPGAKRAVDEWRGDRQLFNNNQVMYYGE